MAVMIDPNKTWAKVEERLSTETDPILRRNLQTVLDHMKSEAVGDLDGLIATLSDDVHYHSYSGAQGGTTGNPASSPKGKDGVRKFYEDFIASGATRLMLDVDRLVVDRDCILTEGLMRMAYPGKTLAARGVKVDDPDAYYLYETRMATMWPLDENGMVRGEDTYTSSDGFAGIENRKLSEDDIAALTLA
jgi:hypothetical protein